MKSFFKEFNDVPAKGTKGLVFKAQLVVAVYTKIIYYSMQEVTDASCLKILKLLIILLT